MLTIPRRIGMRCITTLFAIAGWCDLPAARAQPAERDDPSLLAVELVARLGNAAFSEREAAAKQILAVGPPAIPALRSAANHPSLEIRRRSARLLTDLERRAHEQKLVELQNDPERTPDEFLPGLKRFRETIGRDAAAMSLFVAMCRVEPDLFRLVDAGGRDLEQAFETRSGAMQFEVNVLQSRAKVADRVAAMLFIAADPDLKESDLAVDLVYTFAHQTEFQQAMTQGAAAPSVKKVVGQWVRKPGGVTAYKKLSIAMTLGIPDGIVPALEMLKGPNAVGGQTQFAVLAVARFGNREHVPLIEKILQNKTLLSTNAANNRVTFTCEMRDVALAALLHLTGQDPKGYGFNRLQNTHWGVF